MHYPKQQTVPKSLIRQFCLKNHIKKMSLYGSSLRGELKPDSDVDLLVEFEEGHIPGFFELSEMEDELSAYFEGRKVDLRTPNDLSRYFREDVVSTAEVVYARL